MAKKQTKPRKSKARVPKVPAKYLHKNRAKNKATTEKESKPKFALGATFKRLLSKDARAFHDRLAASLPPERFCKAATSDLLLIASANFDLWVKASKSIKAGQDEYKNSCIAAGAVKQMLTIIGKLGVYPSDIIKEHELLAPETTKKTVQTRRKQHGDSSSC